MSSREYWVTKDRENLNFYLQTLLDMMKKEWYEKFKMYNHTHFGKVEMLKTHQSDTKKLMFLELGIGMKIG